MASVPVQRCLRGKSLIISVWSLYVPQDLLRTLLCPRKLAYRCSGGGHGERGPWLPSPGLLVGCVPCAHVLVCRYVLGRCYKENRAGTRCRDIILRQWSSTDGAEKDLRNKAKDAPVESLYSGLRVLLLFCREQQRCGKARADWLLG